MRLKLSGVVVALGLASFLNDVASEMVIPLLPAFLASLPSGGPFLIGVMEGTAESISAFLRFFSGWLSDRTGKRGVFLITGYATASFARPLMGLAGHALEVVGLRILDRIGKGIRTSPRDAMISDSSGPETMGLAFSFHRAMDHTGALAGPIAAMALISLAGLQIRDVILLSLLPGMLALVPTLAAVRLAGKASGRSRETTGGRAGLLRVGSPLSEAKALGRNFALFGVTCFLFTLGNSSDLFILLRAAEAGVAPHLMPALWIVLHASKIAFSIPAGIISDRIGRRKPIVAGRLVYCATYLLIPFAAGPVHFFLLLWFYGLFFALTEGTERALVSDLVPQSSRGTAFGIYNFAIAAGALPSSILMGALYQWAGPLPAFWVGAGLALISSLLLLFVKEKGQSKLVK